MRMFNLKLLILSKINIFDPKQMSLTSRNIKLDLIKFGLKQTPPMHKM
jgi:hypothetical protein